MTTNEYYIVKTPEVLLGKIFLTGEDTCLTKTCGRRLSNELGHTKLAKKCLWVERSHMLELGPWYP